MTTATIAAATVPTLTASARMIPLPMVEATAVPDMAPNMLSMPAMASACHGVSTRVETTVAMELGASVQPLTNSAARTRRRTTRRNGSI
jgi:hypothetical protein